MGVSSKDDDCLYPSNFFYEMEKQFASLPETLSRKDYAPIFLVNTLQQFLRTASSKNGAPMLLSKNSEVFKMEECPGSGMDNYEGLQDNFLILNVSLKRAIKQLLIFASLLTDTPGLGFNDGKLISSFIAQVQHPSLELVWLLICSSKYKQFSFSAYVMRLQSESRKSFLAKQLLEFGFCEHVFDEAKKRKCTRMLHDFLPEIIIAAYANLVSNEQLIRLRNFSNQILTAINNRFQSNDSSLRGNSRLMLAIFEGVSLPNSLKKKYRLDQLDQILCKTADISFEAIHRQQESLAGTIETEWPGKWETISSLINQQPDIKEEVFRMAQNHIMDDKVNWESLLLFISVTASLDEDASRTSLFPQLKEIIRELLYSGLAQHKSQRVLGGFILARHCCLISPQNFERYEKWYVGVFGNNSSPANKPDTFGFLASVLSDLVPNEPVCFLQVHATYYPYIPQGMKSIWNDYIQKAKARNSEYNVFEQAMEYEPNPNNPIQHDIERILKSFDARQKIPEAISEMLMFRKQYYYEQFLPALLRKPFGVPMSDGKLRLIEALNIGGKIPADLYGSYKAKST